jgi:hypothetical protein
MNQLWWWVVEPVSRFLEHDEREAVLGDLAESCQTGPRGLLDVLDLVIRRQARLWMGWRPWLILFALILPLGMLLSILSLETSGETAVYLWMYANNWDAALTQNPGFWRLFAETMASVSLAYLTLACWSLTGGFVLGSVSRAMGAVNSLLLCLILFFGEVTGAPRYFAFFYTKVFGDLHLPEPNAAVFEVAFYRVVLPVIVQIGLVAIPALWGLRLAMDSGKLGGFLNTALWTAALATLGLLLIHEMGFWLFLAARSLHASPQSRIWTAIIGAPKYLQLVEFWPVAFLIAHAIKHRGIRKVPA